LKLRADKALRIEKIDLVALKKIAAYASHETGDARKAVELLAKTVKVAEETSGFVGEKEVDLAEHRLEVDKTMELISALASQQSLALLSCYAILSKGTKKVSTGQVYEVYRNLCQRDRSQALTQRRFSDMISFLDLYGLINARVVSMGRYGKTRHITSSLPDLVIDKIL
jgi:cell division control protein 6